MADSSADGKKKERRQDKPGERLAQYFKYEVQSSAILSKLRFCWFSSSWTIGYVFSQISVPGPLWSVAEKKTDGFMERRVPFVAAPLPYRFVFIPPPLICGPPHDRVGRFFFFSAVCMLHLVPRIHRTQTLALYCRRTTLKVLLSGRVISAATSCVEANAEVNKERQFCGEIDSGTGKRRSDDGGALEHGTTP